MSPNGHRRRQLRLSIPVSEQEKRQARALAKHEKMKVSELVRALLSERHRRRRERTIAEELGTPGTPAVRRTTKKRPPRQLAAAKEVAPMEETGE